MSFVFSVLAGILCGILSGFGVGGGTVLMLFMVYIAGLPQQMAQGINLLYFLPTAAAALFSHFKNKLIDVHSAIPAILAGVLAAVMTSFIATAMDTNLLRRCWGVFLIAVGLMELFRREKKK